MRFEKCFLGQTNYPDNTYTRYRDNRPIRPYDMSTDNIAEYFGVRADPVSTKVRIPLIIVQEPQVKSIGTVVENSNGYVIDGSQNASFKALNQILHAQELAQQTKNADLQAKFAPVASALLDSEAKIVEELNATQGTAMNIDGYYAPKPAKATDAMRPSSTLNAIVNAI